MRIPVFVWSAALLGLSVLSAPGETPATDLSKHFEAATLKLRPPPARPGGRIDGDAGHREYKNVPLRELLLTALKATNDRLVAPSWTSDEHYDISAVLPLGTRADDIPEMLLTLLKDRLALATHHESKQMSVSILRISPRGLKLKVSESQGNEPLPPLAGVNRGASDKYGLPLYIQVPPGRLFRGNAGEVQRIQGTAATMKTFAEALEALTGTPVVDETGLTKSYDILLTWWKPGQVDVGAEVDTKGLTTIQHALEDQLGLVIQSGKTNVDVTVVDHVEKMPKDE